MEKKRSVECSHNEKYSSNNKKDYFPLKTFLMQIKINGLNGNYDK